MSMPVENIMRTIMWFVLAALVAAVLYFALKAGKLI